VASFAPIPKSIESEVSFCTTLAILFYFRNRIATFDSIYHSEYFVPSIAVASDPLLTS